MDGLGINKITHKGWLFLALWALAILFLYAFSGYIGVKQLQFYKAESDKARKSAVNGTAKESETQSLPFGRRPVDVETGIYINHIGEFSLKENGWAADFDVWFRWNGNEINPGNSFRIINGEVDSRERIAAYNRGSERYERYRIKARLTKFFDPSRFPFSEEMLTIQIEDAIHGPEALRYIADNKDSGISQLGIPNALKIRESIIESNLHVYKSRMGLAGLAAGGASSRSQLVFAMLVDLPGTAVYMRMSQALFVSVAIAFIVFFIRPTFVDPRFGLGVGAVFAAVANNIYVQAMLPPSTQITLAQMTYAASLATVFLTLVQSAISLYILDTLGDEALYRFFDKASFAVFLIGYAFINLALPLAART